MYHKNELAIFLSCSVDEVAGIASHVSFSLESFICESVETLQNCYSYTFAGVNWESIFRLNSYFFQMSFTVVKNKILVEQITRA